MAAPPRPARGARPLAVLDLAARQGRENFLNQPACGFGAELDRDPLTPAVSLVDEVDAERMVELRVIGMVVIDIGGVDPHPAVGALGAAMEAGLLDDVRAHG